MIIHHHSSHTFAVYGLGSAVRIVCLKHVLIQSEIILGVIIFCRWDVYSEKKSIGSSSGWLSQTKYCVWFIYNYILFVKWKVSRDLKLIVNTVTSSVLCIFIYTGRWWEIFDALKWLESFFEILELAINTAWIITVSLVRLLNSGEWNVCIGFIVFVGGIISDNLQT